MAVGALAVFFVVFIGFNIHPGELLPYSQIVLASVVLDQDNVFPMALSLFFCIFVIALVFLKGRLKEVGLFSGYLGTLVFAAWSFCECVRPYPSWTGIVFGICVISLLTMAVEALMQLLMRGYLARPRS